MSNKLALSAPDEYLNHQFALPHQVVASSDPNWRERYWISLFDTHSKDTVLTLGVGKYPNRDVMDNYAILSRGGKQRNLRASRQLLPFNDQIFAGPFSIEIGEPLKTLHLRLDKNETDVEYDLTWHGSVPPALEGNHFEVSRGRVTHQISRYVQTGQVSGTIRCGDEQIEVTPDRWWGVRDHSWGIRPMSGGQGEPPVASVQWNLMAFCPIRFPDFSLHIYLFESQRGRPTHLTAAIMRPEGSGEFDDEIRQVSHDFSWREQAPTQTLIGGQIRIEFYSGKVMEIDVKACAGRAFLKGGGYDWFFGKWWGESHVEHDVWDLTDTASLRGFNSHASDHLIEATCEGQTGFGIIEYLIRRGYDAYPDAHFRR